MFPLSRGTLWLGRPFLRLHATFGAQQPIFEAPGRALCLPNSRFASVLVHFWHEPCFPCLGGGTRVGDHRFSLETTFPRQPIFLSRNWSPRFLCHIYWSPTTPLAFFQCGDHQLPLETTFSGRPLRVAGRPLKVAGRPPFLVGPFPPVLSD